MATFIGHYRGFALYAEPHGRGSYGVWSRPGEQPVTVEAEPGDDLSQRIDDYLFHAAETVEAQQQSLVEELEAKTVRAA